MSEETKDNKIETTVLSAIRQGGVSMRPRWQFILRAVFAFVGVLGIILGLIYLISFVIFIQRATGVGYAPMIGLRGWRILLFSLPWLLIGFAVFFAVLLEILIRRYQFAYRRPILYSVCGMLIVAIGGSLIITSTSFHRRVARSVRVGHMLPFVHTFYGSFSDRQFDGVMRGMVDGVGADTIFLRNRRGELLRAIITPKTRWLSGAVPTSSDMIVIFGDRVATGTIDASGVRVLKDF